MHRFHFPTSTYKYPKGKPFLLVVMPVVYVVAFLGLAVRWTWVYGRLGWDGAFAIQRSWRKIGITLTMAEKGEGKAMLV